MRKSTYIALCVAVGVPMMALKAANAPGIRMLGWSSLADRIQARSRVEAGDDFRQDLRRWAGKEGWSDSWTFNGSGFVIPGQLAIDIRSVPLANYRMEFAGQVERNGLGFVYRAMDFDNYYAARIVIVNGSSIPEAVLERYAVINGQAGPVTKVRLPFPVRTDARYDVEVEATGDHFVTLINHQPVDAFNDSRLPTGGAGLFASPGESARIYRFHVSGHNDLLGKVCSLLAPLS